MKKLLMIVACIATLALTSCSEPFDDSAIWEQLDEYGESIRDHEQRISALEELCKQMNTNIEALQTIVSALEKRDYVTNVSEVRSNGVVIGYTISFAYSGAITIYHGQNGTDGYTPQIGVMQDADGIYYWTLDGEWLLDDNGNKIKANATDGKDGQNGANGSNGSNGTDGVTPLLKIENDYWFVSYDNGASWVQLGKATGDDGIDGENGEDGDSIFKSVTQDDEYVYFNLADGTMITLPKGDKKTTVDDVCSLMEDITFMKYCYDNFDANKDGMLSQTEAASVYTIDIGGLDIYSLAGIEMFTRLESIIAKNCSKLREVVIPNTITLIGNEAFYGCSSLVSVTIPDSVASIGESAFCNCSKLASVTIPDSVTSIGKSAFVYCSSLTSITIPDNITSIGDSTFRSCTSLTSISIPDSVTSIGEYAFYYCTSLTNINIPNNITSIGDSTFRSCTSLTSISIPDSVTSIGEYAFDSCTSLTSVTIPDSVTEIGKGAFYGCSSLTSVTIPDSVTEIGQYAFRDCTGELIVNCNIPSASESSYGAFYASKFTKVTIGEGVTSIGNYAFNGCSSLTRVDISDLSAWCKIDFGSSSANPLYYAKKLYLNGTEITELTIPSDITEIKQYAFYGCSSLTSVTIGNSVTSIGEEAFYDCTSLKDVYCKPITPPTGGNDMFYNNASGRKIYVPSESYNTYTKTTYWRKYYAQMFAYDFEKGEVVIQPLSISLFGVWTVTSPKTYLQQQNLVTEKYEEALLDKPLTRNIEIVDAATFYPSLEGYALIFGWDGFFLYDSPAIGMIYNDNKIELLNNEIVGEGGGAVYQWLAHSSIPTYYEGMYMVGGEYPAYTLEMDEAGNVTVNGYVGTITTGDKFYVETYSIFPVIGEDVYVWNYDEPAYTFAGTTMSAVKVEGELSSVKKASKINVMHKHANAKFNAKHFSAAVQFAK